MSAGTWEEGGGGLQLWLGPFEGRCEHRLPRQGKGGQDQQGWGRRCCPTEARRARSRAMGGHPRRALSPTAAVLPPRPDTRGGQGWDRAGHRQALTR